MLPEVTVITCNYNHSKWIERCIRSIQNQVGLKQNEIEHIIVDDASTDNSVELLKRFDNVHLIENKVNMGLPSSLNIALKKALGRYVVRLDSDDYVSRNFISLHKSFLDYNRHISAVSSDYILVSDNEDIIERKFSEIDFIACGIFYRKEVLFDLGLYNEGFKFREGHELNKRFIESNLLMGYSHFPLYKYRSHNGNRSKLKEIEEYDRKLK
jgi:glycosyltransferase involved in cell wall biosynthesis